MMLLRSPSDDDIRQFLDNERAAAFTYAEVGATAAEGVLPARGYAIDRYGTELGRGEGCFERARAALRAFRNYPSSFTRVITDGSRSVEPGLTFVTHARHLGFHSLNSCRVIAVDEAREADQSRRFSFWFGTLPGHEESGEERFALRYDAASGLVRYDVVAFSHPQGWLARLGAPVARALQRRFQRETCEAMRRAANE